MTDIILSKQIHPSQCQALVQLGIKSLVNLRFDNECQDQPTSIAFQDCATTCHLHYVHLPYQDALPMALVGEFAHTIQHLPKPVLVFCATGSRAKRIYQSAKLSGLLPNF